MKRSKGLRVGTRSILRRRKGERSRINISRVMHDYQEGDRVAMSSTVANKWVCLTADSTAEQDSSKSDKVWLGLSPSKTVTCQKRSLLDLSTFDHSNEELP